MLRKMVIPGERIEEEEGSEYADDTDTDSVTSASIRDIGESTLDSDILSPEHSNRSAAGKAKKIVKVGQPFYKGCGVMYLLGDIKLWVTLQSGTNWLMYWIHFLD